MDLEGSADVFVNHTLAKLALDDPAMSVLPVYVLLLLAAALSMKKAAGQEFLDAGQTGQLKGLAILLIVTGHINLILAGGAQAPNFAGFGVAAFLFCSGYGLAASAAGKEYALWDFVKRRASRIFIPYWIATVAFLAADHIFLGRHYRAGKMAVTMLGLNVTKFTARFDLSRWFITYIIVTYAMFHVSCRLARGWKGRVAIMFGLALVMDGALVFWSELRPMNVAPGDVRHYVMYSLMFPAGCLAAVHAGYLKDIVGRAMKSGMLRKAAVMAVVAFFVLKTLLLDQMRGYFNRADTGSILVESALWQPAFAVFLIIALAALAALWKAELKSRFLVFAGGISYEIYLVHFVFMQRYDPLLYRKPFTLYFMVFLGVVVLMATILNRSSSRIRTLAGIPASGDAERSL